MRIIFSRDRAAQLDLLLRSLERNAPDESTIVLYRFNDGEHLAYNHVIHENRLVVFHPEYPEQGFDENLRYVLDRAIFFAPHADTVTFFCDDDVLYRPVPSLGADLLLANESVLTFSLRLGMLDNDLWYRGGEVGKVYTYAEWTWVGQPPHDHGYPGSIDGHTFRTADVLRMIDGQTIENPLMLETILAHRCSMLAEERPLMACYPEQALVGVPVNTVANDQRRPHGERHPQPADELNARFLAGERIDLDALDFSGVDGCLHEIPFVWRQRVEA